MKSQIGSSSKLTGIVHEEEDRALDAPPPQKKKKKKKKKSDSGKRMDTFGLN